MSGQTKARVAGWTSRLYRIGIVGAASLAGKELSDELGESPLAASNVVLLTMRRGCRAGDCGGRGAAFIQRIEPDSFERMDFVFFAGDAEVTKRHWQEARRAGASIVDLTYALEQEKDVLVMAPWVTEALGERSRGRREPDLKTPAVVAAHPVAVMLALVAAKLSAQIELTSVAATVMEPASEHGRAAMDEMHQQTVSLLSFQSLPRGAIRCAGLVQSAADAGRRREGEARSDRAADSQRNIRAWRTEHCLRWRCRWFRPRSFMGMWSRCWWN